MWPGIWPKRVSTDFDRGDEKIAGDWLTYVLRCADGSLYCGVTKDLDKRVQRHNLGLASKYTRSRRPVTVEAVRGDLSRSEALRLERRIKGLPAAEKVNALEKT
ncbi:MAG: GIY-YIG nuclease family protein [Desulfonatronovibrionaceae bacterium]